MGGKFEDDFRTGNRRAVYMGQVGARFERPGLMEHQTLMNNGLNPGSGLSKAFERNPPFYHPQPQDEEKANSQCVAAVKPNAFNPVYFKERCRIIAESFLYEAQYQGIGHSGVYAVTTGIGLGVWADSISHLV